MANNDRAQLQALEATIRAIGDGAMPRPVERDFIVERLEPLRARIVRAGLPELRHFDEAVESLRFLRAPPRGERGDICEALRSIRQRLLKAMEKARERET